MHSGNLECRLRFCPHDSAGRFKRSAYAYRRLLLLPLAIPWIVRTGPIRT